MEKLEFPVDLKGSRCYKVIGTSNLESGKDSNNNHSLAISKISKALSKKEKTTEEIFDMIGNSIFGYMVNENFNFKNYNTILLILRLKFKKSHILLYKDSF